MSKQFKNEYYCSKCYHTEPHDTVDKSYETQCPSCVEGIMRPNYKLDVSPMSINRCGGKESLSTWEEILHRPRG